MRISPAAVNADDANTTRRTVSIHDERHNHRTTPAASSAGTMSEGRLTIVVVALCHPHLPRHPIRNVAQHRLLHADGGVRHLRRRGAMAHHRLSAAPVHRHPHLTVHGAHIPHQGAARHCRGAVLGRYGGRRARRELPHVAHRATHHGVGHGRLAAIADQHHPRESAVRPSAA